MTAVRQHHIWILLTILSGVTVVVCTALMLADLGRVTWRQPAEVERVETLSEAARSDSGAATPLHALRDSLTTRSLVRKDRDRLLAWVLLCAGSLGVLSAKRLAAGRPQPLPALDDLVSLRFGPTPSLVVGPTAPVHIDTGSQAAFVEELVARFGTSVEAAIPILQAIQSHYRYLPDEALRHLCDISEITPAQIAGTSSFYTQFRRSPVGRHLVRICHGTACHVAGVDQVNRELRRHLEIAPGEDTDGDRMFTLETVACLGCCSLAPVMMVEDQTAGRLTPASARQALDTLRHPV